jgi:hypothetical protein
MPPTFLTRSSPRGGGDSVGVDDRTATDDHANGLHYSCQKQTRFVDLNGSSLQKLCETLEKELDCSADPAGSERIDDHSVHLVVPFIQNTNDDDNQPKVYSFAGKGGCYLPNSPYDCHHVASFGPHLTTENFPPFSGSYTTLQKQMVMSVYSISCINGSNDDSAK